jgi:crotonobetainyl-CoA:carnitine CoA-transferase CaiB-like acyl-CoA transferase
VEKSVDFYFDYGSPTSYLAYVQMPGLAKRTGATVNYKPFLLGGVYQATTNRSPLEIPAKAKWMVADMKFFAERYQVPFQYAVDRPELEADERFSTAERRSLHSTERIALMAEILKGGSRSEWLPRLDAHDVPCAPVLRRSEIIENEQVVATGLVETLEQPAVGQVRQPRPAARFDGSPSAACGPAPGIGEHTEEILRELGLDGGAIEALKSDKVVRVAQE